MITADRAASLVRFTNNMILDDLSKKIEESAEQGKTSVSVDLAQYDVGYSRLYSVLQSVKGAGFSVNHNENLTRVVIQWYDKVRELEKEHKKSLG